MPKIDISVEKTIDLANILSTSLPNTIAAKRNAMDHIQYSWIKNAMNTFQKPTGEYTSSFGQSESTPLTGSVYNYSKHAQVVEQGHSGIDLKKMLYTSPKARWMPRKGPNGSIRYIKAMIIPFRHGIPGTKTLPAMPKEIFKQAKKLETSARISEDFAPAISMNQAKSQKLRGFPTKFGAGGSKVERASYAWGGRLKNVGGNYEGMVRMIGCFISPHAHSTVHNHHRVHS